MPRRRATTKAALPARDALPRVNGEPLEPVAPHRLRLGEASGERQENETGRTTPSRVRTWDLLTYEQQEMLIDALLELVEADLRRYPPKP